MPGSSRSSAHVVGRSAEITGGSNPRPRPCATGIAGSGSPAASYAEQVGGAAARPARVNQPIPQLIRAPEQRVGSRDIADRPGAADLADIAVGQRARGQRDQITVGNPAVAGIATPGMVLGR